ncbi:hypothetical protein GH714_019099 [Hevea brasiliensis]|uniref:FAD-binding FR-type domain-containing protein n=1 Tax=Hevea brasiliensis TaxID=3981 RepID=A0A6A6MXD5_HEVBR|nr:hypothetical protein GH714_019099 [Hevea brasiliensis]
MDQYSVQEPLLSSQGVKKKPLFVSSAKWVLKILMWVIFIAWVVFIFVYPTELGNEIFEKCIGATKGTPFGLSGSIFLLLSGPILLIAILAIAHLIISGKEDIQQKKNSKYPRVRLWTFPVLVGGPFGVVSAAEFIGILLFVVYIIWAVYAYTIRNLSLISNWHFTSKEEGIWLLELTGLRLGMIGLFCLAFLFLPVARGSVLLRLIDIPFEHATRYHVWLGHLTMLLFTLHGLFYVIGWGMQGNLQYEIMEWRDVGIANFAGVVSLLAGLLMWVTSLPDLRYNALSFVFLQIRELSWLQWHPFSVSSSPLDGKNHLSILIKVLGRWTEKLRENIMKTSEVETAKLLDQPFQPHAKITASVEGHMGMKYENLILVAGGIGISPFLAILSDILHRINEGRPCLPKNVLVIWAVKKSNELPLLSTINMESICPYFSDKLNLEICIYVTREKIPNWKRGLFTRLQLLLSALPLRDMACQFWLVQHVWLPVLLSLEVVWLVVASVGKENFGQEEHLDNRMKAEKVPDNEDMTNDNFFEKKHSSFTVIQYGSRPDFKEILGCVSKRWGFVDVGVIICGPPTLQCSVAREIRSQNLRRESDDPVFHFHSHSFDL